MNATKQERKDLDQASTAANDPASAAAAEFEGEVREFVRRDISIRQRPRTPAGGGDAAAENMNSLIQRVSIASMEEIERVISELQAMRDSLRAEADRVQRDITNYAGMSQAAMSSMRVIGDSLRQLKAPVPQIKHEAR